jgi:hypothetical protein
MLSKKLAFAASLAVTCVALWSCQVAAYETYNPGPNNGCVQCHSGFVGKGALHDMHVGNQDMTNNCSVCHISTGDNPRIGESGADPNYGCNGCHSGPGLRAHHANAAAPPDGNGLTCATCHQDDPTPQPESTVLPFYARADVNVKLPCEPSTASGGEDHSSDGQGLDNDGDLAYDRDDPDCGPVPVQETRWGGIKALYRE